MLPAARLLLTGSYFSVVAKLVNDVVVGLAEEGNQKPRLEIYVCLSRRSDPGFDRQTYLIDRIFRAWN